MNIKEAGQNYKNLRIFYLKLIRNAQIKYGNKLLEQKLNKSNKYFYKIQEKSSLENLKKIAETINTIFETGN
jgi:hypothetical protein